MSSKTKQNKIHPNKLSYDGLKQIIVEKMTTGVVRYEKAFCYKSVEPADREIVASGPPLN